MKRSGPLKRFTRLRQRSAKRARADAEYGATRATLLAATHSCLAAGFMDVPCGGRLDVHHVLRRSQGGTNDPGNLLVVCRAHHHAIHGHPTAATRAGLLRSRAQRRLT